MRLFFGLSLPDDVRCETARLSSAAEAIIPGRYTPAENHHITLAFLGETPESRVQDAADVLARCAASFPAPRVTLDGFSYFNRPQNAILILRARSEPALEPLNTALKSALAAQNLPFDPGLFSPHVTLARHAQLGNPPVFPPVFVPIRFAASQAHLFLSARDDAGILRYTPIFSASFANSGF